MVAFQLAGRATRDALYLSTFPLSTLPRMVMASAVLAAVICIAVSRKMASTGPARLVPRLFVVSAILLLVEWGLAGVARPAASILFYLHFSALGALLISGFWAMVNERFDPRTARRVIGRITVGATVGGLLGGLLPERVGAALSLRAMFPLLAVLHVLSAWLVRGLRVPAAANRADAPDAAASPARTLLGSPYLRGLVWLVVLTAVAEGLLDFVFKARATAASTNGESLLRLFARFYTVAAMLSIVVQTVALRPILARLGVARSAALLPTGVALGAVGGLLLPGLWPILVARGTEVVLRNSVFRGAYELLFTPVSAAEKRATKLLVDVGASRLGDAAGGALIQLTLVVAAASAGQWLLGGVCLLAVMAALLARRLHRGYVGALEQGLALRAGDLPALATDSGASVLRTFGGFEITRHALTAPADRAPTPVSTTRGAEPVDPERRRHDALHAADPATVRAALLEGPLPAALVGRAIELLAWDDVASAAVTALRGTSPDTTDRLIERLLDPGEEFSIRRRLALVLGERATPEACAGLVRALDDRRFEVRYRAGRSLDHLRDVDPRLVVSPARILAVVRKEVEVERGVWQSRQLIDDAEDPWAREDEELVHSRAGRSMEHVFTLLSLVLPREPLRLAFRGLRTDDARLRGTALEYLETVLPEGIRERLWPFLEPGERRARPSAETAEAALANLLASRDSIQLALAARPNPAPGGEAP